MRARATFCGVSGMWSGMGWVRGRPRGLVGWSFILLGMVFPLLYSRDITTTQAEMQGVVAGLELKCGRRYEFGCLSRR